MTDPKFQLTFQTSKGPRTAEFTSDEVTIGRHPGCGLEVADDSVSRHHARIVRDGAGWKVEDTKSRNGVYVNLRKVESSPLRNRDLLVLGRVEFSFEVLDAPELDQVGAPSFSDSETDSDPIVSQSIDVSSFKARLSSEPYAAPGTDVVAPSDDLQTISNERRSVDLFGLVTRAAEALIAPDGLEDVLRSTLRLVFEALPAERGCVILLDSESGERTSTIFERRDPADRTDFTVSSSVVQRVFDRREAVLVANSLDDADFSAQQSIVLEEIRSIVCAPLYYEGGVAGVIYLDSRNVGRMFDRTHLEVLTTISLLAGTAVERARLEKRLRDEESIRERLSRYSAPSVVEKIIQNRAGIDDRSDMIAEERDVSVLFLDIVSFTSLSETLSPIEVTLLLNEVFEELTASVFEFEGTLDKFTGDGLMAVFGAPLDQSDHAERAIRAGLSMQQRLARINASRSDTVVARIGINSGSVLAGDIGSPRRKDYTVIGDTVNVASRLEAKVARPGDVVVGEETLKRCPNVSLEFDDLGDHEVKGKSARVRAYRVIPIDPDLESQNGAAETSQPDNQAAGEAKGSAPALGVGDE